MPLPFHRVLSWSMILQPVLLMPATSGIVYGHLSSLGETNLSSIKTGWSICCETAFLNEEIKTKSNSRLGEIFSLSSYFVFLKSWLIYGQSLRLPFLSSNQMFYLLCHYCPIITAIKKLIHLVS